MLLISKTFLHQRDVFFYHFLIGTVNLCIHVHSRLIDFCNSSTKGNPFAYCGFFFIGFLSYKFNKSQF